MTRKYKSDKRKKYTINGQKKNLQEWCDQYGLTVAKVLARINRLGWTLEEALELKERPPRYNAVWRELTIANQTHSVDWWSELKGVPVDLIRRRITQLGWTPAEAVGLLPRSKKNDRRRMGPVGRRHNLLTYGDKTRTMKEWAEITGIPYRTLMDRFEKRLTPSQILTPGRLPRGTTGKNSRSAA